MMHYKKGKNIEEELTKETIPLECVPKDSKDFLWMHVKGGTTVSNVVDFARKALDTGEHRSVVWTSCGGGVTKTISCAEILKRHYDLHQVTRLCFKKVEEYWDPLLVGLEQIVASREIPCIHILLSLDEIDPTTPGYQNSKSKTKFWQEKRDNGKDNEDKGRAGPSNRGGRGKSWQNQQNRKRKQKKDNNPPGNTNKSKPDKIQSENTMEL